MNLVLNKRSGLFSSFCLLSISAIGVAVTTDVYWIAVLPFGVLLFYASWLHPQFLFYLLICSLPFSREFHFSETLGTDFPDELLMWLVSLITVAVALYKNPLILRKKMLHPLLILIAIIFLWSTLTVIFSSQPFLSLKFILAKSWYLLAFLATPLLIFKTSNWLRTAAHCFCWSMFIVTIIIIVKHSQTDFSFASVNDAVSPFFRNHVNYAAMLVCAIPVCWTILRNQNKLKFRLINGAFLSIFLFALYFSYSRGAWLALIAGMIAWWLIRNRLFIIGYCLFIIVSTSAIFWLKKDNRYLDYAHQYKTTVFHKDFSQHLISTYKLKDLSTEERFYRWIAGIRMIKDNWLTGSGPNTFYPLYKSYAIPAYKTWVSDNPEHSTVHNYFLLILIEQGVPALIFFLVLLGVMIYYIEKGYNQSGDPYQKNYFLCLGSILAMIIALNFLSDLIETDKIGSVFYLLIAALIVNLKGSNIRTRAII